MPVVLVSSWTGIFAHVLRKFQRWLASHSNLVVPTIQVLFK